MEKGTMNFFNLTFFFFSNLLLKIHGFSLPWRHQVICYGGPRKVIRIKRQKYYLICSIYFHLRVDCRDIRVTSWHYQVQSVNKNLVNSYPFLVNYRNSRKRSDICSKLKIRTPVRCHSGVFIVNFERISLFFLVCLLLSRLCLDCWRYIDQV